MYKGIFLFALMWCFLVRVQAQNREESILFGNMDSWVVREIEESFVVGGRTVYLYEIGKSSDTLRGNMPYESMDSPWATSSMLTHIGGIYKSSVTVFPERRGNGCCARLETRIESFRVLGMVNFRLLAGGSIFLGAMNEPITDANDPHCKLSNGISFNKCPYAVQFDYKIKTGGKAIRVLGNSQEELDEEDRAEMCVILQYRWEDTKGNVYAKRVATAWEFFGETKTDWQNNYQVLLHYGDITGEPFYTERMGLRSGENAYCTRNSKGDIVPIREVGWAGLGEKPNCVMLRFSSSVGGAYVGKPGNCFWVDNVAWIYKE